MSVVGLVFYNTGDNIIFSYRHNLIGEFCHNVRVCEAET